MKMKCLLIPLWVIFVVALFGTVIMLLWNWLIPAIFGLAAINYWQALGLFLLSRILFGGFGFGHGMAGRMHRKKHRYIHDKWMKMTQEQRCEFINRRMKFGFCKPFDRGDFFSGDCCGKDATNESGKKDE